MRFSRYVRKLFRVGFGAPSFFLQKRLLPAPPRSDDFLPLFSREWGGDRSEIIGIANRIITGEYCFLGVSIAEEPVPKWHKDYLTGYVWPLLPFHKIRGMTPGGVEIKNPWELSSFFHLFPVAIAFSLTKDPRYKDFFIQQVTNWAQENPCPLGVNWCNPMVVAFRLIQLVEAISFGFDKELPVDFSRKVENLIWEHLVFLVNNLENIGGGGNHYVANLIGLLWGSLFFSQKNFYVRWVKYYAVKSLSKEVLRQVNEGGMHFEGSTGYHRLVTEMFLYSAILMRNNAITPPESYELCLREMLEVLSKVTLPNGNIPLIGDSDDSKLFWSGDYFELNRRESAYLLNSGAAYFNFEKWFSRQSKALELSVLIWGEEKINKLSIKKQRENFKSHKQWEKLGGLHISKSENDCLIVNCIHSGIVTGGHSHNDSLGFILFLCGFEVFVDPGTYVYTRDLEMRNYFRSTSSHNVLMVDRQEQWPFPENVPFLLKKEIPPRVLFLKSGEEGSMLEGEHYGYLRLPGGVVHKRYFVWSDDKSKLLIRDNLYGLSEPIVERNLCLHSFFHLSPYVGAKKTRSNRIEIFRKSDEVRLCTMVWSSEKPVSVTFEKSWVSEGYGVKKNSEKIVFEFNSALPFEFDYTILKCN